MALAAVSSLRLWREAHGQTRTVAGQADTDLQYHCSIRRPAKPEPFVRRVRHRPFGVDWRDGTGRAENSTVVVWCMKGSSSAPEGAEAE